MLDLTTVISFRNGGIYYQGEIFIHTATNKEKKILIVISDGFDDPIVDRYISKKFFEFIKNMFGIKENYIFILNIDRYMYRYEVVDTDNFIAYEKMDQDGSEMVEFIEKHKEYFNGKK